MLALGGPAASVLHSASVVEMLASSMDTVAETVPANVQSRNPTEDEIIRLRIVCYWFLHVCMGSFVMLMQICTMCY